MIDLFRLSHEGSHAAFALPLPDAPALHILEIVRRVPGRRLVCRALWNDQQVYAKLFIGSHAARHAARDAAGVRRLVDAGILTPPLLHVGLVGNDVGTTSANVLIFAAIDGENAENVWRALDDEGRRQLATRLVAVVASHHNAGLQQTDLYLKNFLVAGHCIHTLDGDGIKALPGLFARRAALANLVLLLSKFDALETQRWLDGLLHTYCSERALPLLDADSVACRVTARRRKSVDAYANRKVFRNCTDIEVFNSGRQFLAMARPYSDAALKSALMSAPDSLLRDSPDVRLKTGNSSTVGLCTINGRKLVVKRYNIKSFWHGLSRFWRPSRAADSWANAYRLGMYAILTAVPVALLETRFGPFRGRAFFVAAHVASPDLAHYLEDAAVSEAQKKQSVQELARLMYKMLLLQIAHGDLKASNILVEDGRPVLIDLDSLREYRCKHRFEVAHVRDLKRLLKNWQDKPQVREWLIAALHEVYGDHALLAGVGINRI